MHLEIYLKLILSSSCPYHGCYWWKNHQCPFISLTKRLWWNSALPQWSAGLYETCSFAINCIFSLHSTGNTGFVLCHENKQPFLHIHCFKIQSRTDHCLAVFTQPCPHLCYLQHLWIMSHLTCGWSRLLCLPSEILASCLLDISSDLTSVIGVYPADEAVGSLPYPSLVHTPFLWREQ